MPTAHSVAPSLPSRSEKDWHALGSGSDHDHDNDNDGDSDGREEGEEKGKKRGGRRRKERREREERRGGNFRALAYSLQLTDDCGLRRPAPTPRLVLIAYRAADKRNWNWLYAREVAAGGHPRPSTPRIRARLSFVDFASRRANEKDQGSRRISNPLPEG
jgi:hypothetical protein